jgi:hypothetical protein
MRKVVEIIIMVGVILLLNNEIYKLGYEKGYCDGVNKTA